MALIKCPECGKEISSHANACPHCGYPIDKSNETSLPAESSDKKTAGQSEVKDSKAVKGSDKRNKGNPLIPIILCLIAFGGILFSVYLSNQPKYSGYPHDVAKQVGAKSIYDSNGPKVQLTVMPFSEDISIGDDTFIMRNPITGDLAGFAHLKSPASRNYSGTLTVVGDASECDGVSEITITNAEIVSGG